MHYAIRGAEASFEPHKDIVELHRAGFVTTMYEQFVSSR